MGPKGNGKGWRGQREKEKSTTLDLAEISPDHAPCAHTHGTTRNDFPVTRGPAGLTPQRSGVCAMLCFLYTHPHTTLIEQYASWIPFHVM